MDNAYFYAVLAPAEARRAAAGTEWVVDDYLTEALPGGLQVVRHARKLEDPYVLAAVGEQLHQQLADRDLRPFAIEARVDSESPGSRTAPRERWGINLLASEVGQSHLPIILDDAFNHSTDFPWLVSVKEPGPVPPDPVPPKSNGSLPATDPAKAAQGGKKDEAPAPCCTAETIKAAVPAFGDPTALWPHVDAADRGELAKKVVGDLYADRSRFARSSEWTFSPETVLLEASPEDQRGDLAQQLLRVRGELTEADAKLRESRAALEAKKVELAAKDVELAGKRVELAGKGIDIAGEMLAHMQKWRSIANWGIGALCVTTVFSMAAVAYTLLKLMPDGKISDAAAPIIIFVLALFAISPAVLLLRERPLEGLDKWSPGGGAAPKKEEGGDPSSDDSSAGESAKKGKSAKGKSSASET